MPKVIANQKYPSKPPRYWLEAKRQLGFSDAAWGRIWWRNYKDEKRFLAWMAADASEWAEHGCIKP